MNKPDIKVYEKVREAISNQDSIAYFSACNDLGLSPELPDFYEEGAKLFLNQKLSRNSEYLKYSKFVQLSKDQNLSLDDIFGQTDAKSRLLTDILGLKRLKISSQLNMPTSECKPERIGTVFRDYYNLALKRISSLEKKHSWD